jgi:hypothetical protein
MRGARREAKVGNLMRGKPDVDRLYVDGEDLPEQQRRIAVRL